MNTLRAEGAWVPMHAAATVTSLPTPSTSSDGVEVPAAWRSGGYTAIAVRMTKAAAAQTVSGFRVAFYTDDGQWVATDKLNGGADVVLDSIGYVTTVVALPALATRMAPMGTCSAAQAFAVAAIAIREG